MIDEGRLRSGQSSAIDLNGCEFLRSLPRAGRDFDVLVVGYVSRFVRDLRTAVNARHDLHAAGAAILFADDRLLTSDENAWEAWAPEAVESEAYSRRLGRRIAEGYTAKRRRLGLPVGNRPPLGTRRADNPPGLAVDPEGIAVVRRAFDLSAGGLTDRQVAAQLGLKLTHVREVLTNPYYRGVLRDGSRSALGPLVDPTQWDKVQAIRQRYSRRHRGAVRRRQYALAGLLVCGACGRRLTGHTGRYRHVDACEAFVAAAPPRRRAFSRNYDGRARGESYKAEWYDAIVGAALQRVAVNAALATETITKALAPTTVRADTFTLARIAKDREAVVARYLRDRDAPALDAVMRRLDEEEARAEESEVAVPTHDDVVGYLANLSKLWDETETEGRHAIAEAMFDRLDVLGLDVVATPSIEADQYGWADVFGSGTLEVPLMCSISRSGRGERTSPYTLSPILLIPVTNVPTSVHRAWEVA